MCWKWGRQSGEFNILRGPPGPCGQVERDYVLPRFEGRSANGLEWGGKERVKERVSIKGGEGNRHRMYGLLTQREAHRSCSIHDLWRKTEKSNSKGEVKNGHWKEHLKLLPLVEDLKKERG